MTWLWCLSLQERSAGLRGVPRHGRQGLLAPYLVRLLERFASKPVGRKFGPPQGPSAPQISWMLEPSSAMFTSTVTWLAFSTRQKRPSRQWEVQSLAHPHASLHIKAPSARTHGPADTQVGLWCWAVTRRIASKRSDQVPERAE